MTTQMRIRGTDVTCRHCATLFVVECECLPLDRADAQVVACPVPVCQKPNHPILRGEQVNWFVVDAEVSAVRRWQSDPAAHRLTCSQDSSHEPLVASRDSDGRLVLRCPDCDYRQTRIPEAVLVHRQMTDEEFDRMGRELFGDPPDWPKG